MTSRQLMTAAALTATLALLTTVTCLAGSLTVTVVDKGTGAALAQAAVTVVSGESVVASGRTNAQGAWTGTVPDATVTVLAAKDLHVTGRQTVNAADVSATKLQLAPHSQQDFKRLGRIVGFVRSNAGQPIANAALVLFKGKSPVGTARPENASGVYELEWYAPGAYSVLATAPGHDNAKFTGQTIAAGESLWLDVTLNKK